MQTLTERLQIVEAKIKEIENRNNALDAFARTIQITHNNSSTNYPRYFLLAVLPETSNVTKSIVNIKGFLRRV